MAGMAPVRAMVPASAIAAIDFFNCPPETVNTNVTCFSWRFLVPRVTAGRNLICLALIESSTMGFCDQSDSRRFTYC